MLTELLLLRNGEEWYNNRRVMNPLLLNGDEKYAKELTLIATKRLIHKWKELCENSSQYYEVKNLENALYRWSIDGNALCTNNARKLLIFFISSYSVRDVRRYLQQRFSCTFDENGGIFKKHL